MGRLFPLRSCAQRSYLSGRNEAKSSRQTLARNTSTSSWVTCVVWSATLLSVGYAGPLQPLDNSGSEAPSCAASPASGGHTPKGASEIVIRAELSVPCDESGEGTEEELIWRVAPTIVPYSHILSMCM